MHHPLGTPVSVVMTKWGGRPHWEYAGHYLGADEHGEWLGFPSGTHYRRPGLDFVADFASAVLLPRGDQGYMAAFNDSWSKAAIYVDMTTPATWDGTVVRSTDLDLDVVQLPDGTVYLDDEDEFADHQIAYGYPPEIVALAEASAAEVLAAVRLSQVPFDGTAQRWLAALAGLGQ